jgi:6-phospho-3-hexuloisomerase
MLHLHEQALAELGHCLSGIDGVQFEAAVGEISNAKRIALYGVGREGLQIMA